LTSHHAGALCYNGNTPTFLQQDFSRPSTRQVFNEATCHK
jgi:hypothetical protein